MLSKAEVTIAQKNASHLLEVAGIVITDEEQKSIEVSDFGLGDLENTGLQLLVYLNTDRVCAKELVLLPGQTCPEHRHPTIDGQLGKEETFRCRVGTVYLYVEGLPTAKPACPPSSLEPGAFSVWHEIVLQPGDQHTVLPDTLHWFRAGPTGAIVTEFSTSSTDDHDVFTDRRIRRATVIAD